MRNTPGSNSMEVTPLTTGYTIPVRILDDPRGLLLVQSADEIAARYRDIVDDLEIAMGADTEDARAAQRDRLAAAERQEKQLFAQLEQERGAEFQTFRFTFRQATLNDVLAAEGEAGHGPGRVELVYRRALAQRTIEDSDFPGFDGFGKLRTDVALLVMRECVKRLTFSGDPRDFLLTPPSASGEVKPSDGSKNTENEEESDENRVGSKRGA